MFTVGRIALFRDAGLGCLGSFRAVRISFWRIYLAFGWRVSK
jgi:hypothetical protein